MVGAMPSVSIIYLFILIYPPFGKERTNQRALFLFRVAFSCCILVSNMIFGLSNMTVWLFSDKEKYRRNGLIIRFLTLFKDFCHFCGISLIMETAGVELSNYSLFIRVYGFSCCILCCISSKCFVIISLTSSSLSRIMC